MAGLVAVFFDAGAPDDFDFTGVLVPEVALGFAAGLVVAFGVVVGLGAGTVVVTTAGFGV